MVPTIRNILGGFLFSGDDVYKQVRVLSGGERTRLAVARMLLRPSNTLLLDEPTNHLDLDSKEVLLDALVDYGGTLIFVSHDRYFVERLATKIIEVGNGDGGASIRAPTRSSCGTRNRQRAAQRRRRAGAAASRATATAHASRSSGGRSRRRRPAAGSDRGPRSPAADSRRLRREEEARRRRSAPRGRRRRGARSTGSTSSKRASPRREAGDPRARSADGGARFYDDRAPRSRSSTGIRR